MCIYIHIYIYIYVYIYLYAGCSQSWQEDESQGRWKQECMQCMDCQTKKELEVRRRQQGVGRENFAVPTCCDEATALWVGHHLHISPNKSLEGQASSRQARRDHLQVLSKSKGPLGQIGKASQILETVLVVLYTR